MRQTSAGSKASTLPIPAWNPAQCAAVGIGLVFFQLTSEWNWLAGAPWQAADLDGNSETMFSASNEVPVKVFEEYAKRCCSFVL